MFAHEMVGEIHIREESGTGEVTIPKWLFIELVGDSKQLSCLKESLTEYGSSTEAEVSTYADRLYTERFEDA